MGGRDGKTDKKGMKDGDVSNVLQRLGYEGGKSWEFQNDEQLTKNYF
jgi:hypothetical protein